jgi:hypothetical protein
MNSVKASLEEAQMKTLATRFAATACLAGGVALVLAGVLYAQATDPLIGTWRLDAAKSTYKPGPGPKSYTVTIEAAGGKAVKVAIEGVAADGSPVKFGYTSQRDGKDVPVTGSPAYDTANVVQTTPRTGTVTYKKAGKTVATVKTEVSADGKTLSGTVDGTDAKGQPMHNVLVFNKQ